MKREDIMLLAQLYHAMEEAVEHAKKSLAKKDNDELARAKREILDLQKKIERIITEK